MYTQYITYRMEEKFGGGENLVNRLVSSIWRKKVWQINRSANRLLIISTNLDGFSLVNHRQFTKFANVSPCQSFLPYGIYVPTGEHDVTSCF